MSVPIAIHASRNFRRRTVSNGAVRGLENYYALTHGERPAWWEGAKGCVPDDAVGVLENCFGDPRDALVICESGLVVIGSDGRPRQFVAFSEMRRVDLPSKDPVSRSLILHMQDGQTREVPAYLPDGLSFSLYRFLLSAKSTHVVHRE